MMCFEHHMLHLCQGPTLNNLSVVTQQVEDGIFKGHQRVTWISLFDHVLFAHVHAKVNFILSQQASATQKEQRKISLACRGCGTQDETHSVSLVYCTTTTLHGYFHCFRFINSEVEVAIILFSSLCLLVAFRISGQLFFL